MIIKYDKYDKSYGVHYYETSDLYKIGKPFVIISHGNLHFLNTYYSWSIGDRTMVFIV